MPQKSPHTAPSSQVGESKAVTGVGGTGPKIGMLGFLAFTMPARPHCPCKPAFVMTGDLVVPAAPAVICLHPSQAALLSPSVSSLAPSFLLNPA